MKKKWNGKGKEFDRKNNYIYEGEYKNGIKSNGRIYKYENLGFHNNDKCFNKKLIMECEYKDGEIKGKGKEYHTEGYLIFEGEYLNGKRNGRGKRYDKKRNILFEGEYLNNEIWNGIVKRAPVRRVQTYI